MAIKARRILPAQLIGEPSAPTAPVVPVPPPAPVAAVTPAPVTTAEWFRCHSANVIMFAAPVRRNDGGKPYICGIRYSRPEMTVERTRADGSTKRYLLPAGDFLACFTSVEYASNLLATRTGDTNLWLNAKGNVHNLEWSDVEAAVAFARASGLK